MKGTLDYFSVLVIGDNPDEQIGKYDSMKDVPKPYILYNYSDIHKLRGNKLKIYQELLKKFKNSREKEPINKKIAELKGLSDQEYYQQLGELNSFDEHNNIISTENPYGKWLTCEKGGRIFSKYMLDYNGNGLVSGKKEDFDWSLFHMNQQRVDVYGRTWDLCVNNIKPETDKDATILKNMAPYKSIFKTFKNKEDYIKTSCSFWTYAIVFNGDWLDMYGKDGNTWICHFYDTFIKSLPKDELITIYECTN